MTQKRNLDMFVTLENNSFHSNNRSNTNHLSFTSLFHSYVTFKLTVTEQLFYLKLGSHDQVFLETPKSLWLFITHFPNLLWVFQVELKKTTSSAIFPIFRMKIIKIIMCRFLRPKAPIFINNTLTLNNKKIFQTV